MSTSGCAPRCSKEVLTSGEHRADFFLSAVLELLGNGADRTRPRRPDASTRSSGGLQRIRPLLSLARSGSFLVSQLDRRPAKPTFLPCGSISLTTQAGGQRVRAGQVSTPPGQAGQRVWRRVAVNELVITARTSRGLAEIPRRQLPTPGSPALGCQAG